MRNYERLLFTGWAVVLILIFALFLKNAVAK